MLEVALALVASNRVRCRDRDCWIEVVVRRWGEVAVCSSHAVDRAGGCGGALRVSSK